MQIRKMVGQHDTGLFDKADPIRTTNMLGKNVGAAEAMKLTQAHKGAELLIEKQDHAGSKTYDVYALAVEGKAGSRTDDRYLVDSQAGKALSSIDLFEHIEFEDNLAEAFGGTQAIFAPANEKWDSPDEDFVPYYNVRENQGLSLEGIQYAVQAGTVNLLSLITTGEGAVPPTLGPIHMNERFKYEAEHADKATTQAQ